MKVGLIDVDGHAKKKKWGATIYPNLALCKIASYHRSKGDDVEWYQGLFGCEYDLVYMAKVFSFSPDYQEYVNAKKVIKGGTGYDVHSILPQEIDDCQPDYSIYPHIPNDVSYGFLTRGCPNKAFGVLCQRKKVLSGLTGIVIRLRKAERKLSLWIITFLQQETMHMSNLTR